MYAPFDRPYMTLEDFDTLATKKGLEGATSTLLSTRLFKRPTGDWEIGQSFSARFFHCEKDDVLWTRYHECRNGIPLKPLTTEDKSCWLCGVIVEPEGYYPKEN